MKEATQLYAIRQRGAYLRRGLKIAWTMDITEVRLYARLRDARQRISMLWEHAQDHDLGKMEVVAFALVGPVEVIPAKAGSK